MREFVDALRTEGHEISVVVSRIGETPTGLLDIPTYTFPRDFMAALIEEARTMGEERHLLAALEDIYQGRPGERFLTDLHNKKKFSLVYERYSLFSTAGLDFARQARLPFVLEVNSPLILETIRYRQLALPKMAGAIEKHVFTGADKVIAISDAVKEYIYGVAPEARVMVIPNGVNVDRFSYNGTTDDPNHPSVQTNEADFTVGFVGNIRPWHGVELLIDSFANIAQEDKRSRLLIIGDSGKMMLDLEKRCQSLGLDGRVIFTGAISFDDIPVYLRGTDVLVAPYPNLPDFYFSSLKLFEYMAAGKAIVASKIGQIAEILEHEKTALLVPPGDKYALCDAISRLRKNPELRRRLGENARNEACQKHTWRNRMEIIINMFQELLRKKSSRQRQP